MTVGEISHLRRFERLRREIFPLESPQGEEMRRAPVAKLVCREVGMAPSTHEFMLAPPRTAR